jgi:hypothetical protein
MFLTPAEQQYTCWGNLPERPLLLDQTSVYLEGPTNGRLDAGFRGFPLFWRKFPVASACSSRSGPDLNSLEWEPLLCMPPPPKLLLQPQSQIDNSVPQRSAGTLAVLTEFSQCFCQSLRVNTAPTTATDEGTLPLRKLRCPSCVPPLPIVPRPEPSHSLCPHRAASYWLIFFVRFPFLPLVLSRVPGLNHICPGQMNPFSALSLLNSRSNS